jgi:hypothetical protein
MNQNYKTDAEFEDFLASIGGLENAYRIGEKPILNRRQFNVDNGWLGIIQRLFEELISLGWEKKFISVKEKFGGMSIFLENLPENGFKIVLDAEKETFSTCQICGEKGEQEKIKGWVYTLCKEHMDEKLYVEYNGKTYLTKLLEPIKNGDLYYNAKTNEIMICDVNNFFDPWCLKAYEIK